MAVQLNSELLRPIFDWFVNELVVFNEQATLNPQVSIQMLKEPDGRRRLCNFLSSADISIESIEVVSRNVQVQPSELGTAPIQVVQYAQSLFERGDRGRSIQPRTSSRSMPCSTGTTIQAMPRRYD